MSKTGDFKRVLTISNVPVTPYSAQGASRGSWFRDWDKDKLAMMSFAKADADNDFAGHLFDVSLDERVGGKLVKKFFKPAEYKSKPEIGQTLDSKYAKKKRGLKERIKTLLGLLMFPKYSARLEAFIADYKPEIIFSTVADCYGARLAPFLAKKANIPYIIQQEDNWLVSETEGSLLKPLIVAVRKTCLKHSLKGAARRYVICPGMKDYFEAVFNLPFENLLCADEPERFLPPEKHDPQKKTVFLYMGNSRPGRSGEFVKIAQSIKNNQINNPEFQIYSTNAYKEDVEVLNAFGFVKFFETPHHDDVPMVLSRAHVLVLPESFEEKDIEYTRLALSSKAQIFMMAKVPILVFADKRTGLMDYALKTGFGFTVTEDSQDALDQAVYSIVFDTALREKLIEQAYQTALENHDAKKIRGALKSALSEICNSFIQA